MRILFCNKYNFPFSGTEVYLFELMQLLRGQGHEVALFSMADPRGEPTPYDRNFVPHIDFKDSGAGAITKIRNAGHAIYSREAQRRLRRMIAEFRPDVAHVRNIYHHLSPSILWELKAHDIPVVYHLNDFKVLCPNYNFVAHGKVCERCQGGRFWHVITEDCYSGPRGSAVALAAEAYFHRVLGTYQKCVDRFLAPSRFVKEKLAENGWDRQKIDVLPHFQRLPDAVPGVSDDAPLLYFGRVSEEKGVADLIRAVQPLPGLRLQIAGDGPQHEELRLLVQRLNIQNVEFLGHLNGQALEQTIAGSRFTVLPSHAYETLGKSILESFAWARPVIASDLGSRRELVDEGKTGLLYRGGDIAQLTAAISFLHERPEIAKRMGRAGREFVRTNHGSETHLLALTLLYEGMVKRARPRPQLISNPLPRSRGLRIAFIGGRGVSSKYSGIETYYEEVGSRLAAIGHTVTAYCRPYFTPALTTYAGMKIVRIPTIRTKHVETALHTLLSTIHASLGNHDIVHFHALGPALFSFVPRLFGKKTVVTVQGLDWQRKKWGWLASCVLRLGEHAAGRFPNVTMTVSQTLQQHYRDHHRSETHYVPNGTQLRTRGGNERLVEWGLQPDRYILFMGRLSPEKNCDLLIEAYKRLDTQVKLAFAGGSSHSDEYVRTLHQHESANIIFLPWLSGAALDELLTHAMIFVLPSDLEGLSLALLDAMGAGVCVLTSDIPENIEAVNGAGFTFRRGDQEHLSEQLQRLIASPHLRRTAGKSAVRKVRAHYLWGGIVGQIEQIYLSLSVQRPVMEIKKEAEIRPMPQSEEHERAA
jgi:glycosyltransferase involved in cell wall biosynthesis